MPDLTLEQQKAATAISAPTQERQRAEQERQRAERFAAQLRELGINPEEMCMLVRSHSHLLNVSKLMAKHFSSNVLVNS